MIFDVFINPDYVRGYYSGFFDGAITGIIFGIWLIWMQFHK